MSCKPLGDASRLLAAAVAAACGTQAAAAGPLTCATFRDRLEGALIATSAADKNAEIPAFAPRRETSGGDGRLTWKTSDLSGTLSCGAADQFQEFYINREVVARNQLAEQVAHLVALDGAAICTVVAAAPGACIDAGKLLLQNAVQQMGAGLARRLNNPNGLSRAVFINGVTAEMTAAPTLITFSLAVKEGGDVDESRQPLGRLVPDKPAP